MIKFGSARDRRRAEALMVSAHRLHVIVELMDLSHRYLSDLSNVLLSGQVNIDTTADVTRSATLELLDANHRLKLDAEGPEDGSMYITRMVKVTYVISSIDRSESYTIPIFCGPLTKVDRSGPVVSVEAQGKETLSFATAWHLRTYKKGSHKTSVIRMVMKDAGEANSKINIKNKKPTLGNAIGTDRKKTFWKVAKKISHSMNMQLFYDGRGVLKLRRIPGNAIYTFKAPGSLMSYPQVTYDTGDIYNCVEVIGGKPKKAKKKVHFKKVAPARHPLSPSNLGRNGTKRYLPLRIEDDSIKSKKAAKRVAVKQLRAALHETVEVSFDSLPIPHLEELDLCRFNTDITAGKFRLQKMSIPLTADGTSSVGYLRRVSPRRRAVNKNHRKRG